MSPLRGFAPRGFGLRPRLLAALLLTSAATLAVAALALLSPLEHRLRVDGESGVYSAIGAARPEFREIDIEAASGRPDKEQLALTTGLLRRRAGGQVTILDRQLDVVSAPSGGNLDVPTYYPAVRHVFATGHGVHTLTGDDLIAVEPITISGVRYALVLVKRLQYVSSAVTVVRKAFLEAAGAGLGIALLLGLAFTTTLLRRLERLRGVARELERRGVDAPLPIDSSHDEIGDLARAFASMQSRLRRQEAARRAFVATASHELRTPLASLDGMLELLQDDLASEHLDLEDARKRTARAREQSRRLSNLASDLLDLSRLDAEVRLRSEPLELGEISRAVAAEFEVSAAERGVQIELTFPPESCWVAADPGAVARIVRILLDNALRVAPAGSHIELGTSQRGVAAQIGVRDFGPGVPAPERELIFERFQRGTTTGGRGGFGLGLAIGRELALRMGGTLKLADGTHDGDARQGPGACFVLRLPSTDPDAEEEPKDT